MSKTTTITPNSRRDPLMIKAELMKEITGIANTILTVLRDGPIVDILNDQPCNISSLERLLTEIDTTSLKGLCLQNAVFQYIVICKQLIQLESELVSTEGNRLKTTEKVDQCLKIILEVYKYYGFKHNNYSLERTKALWVSNAIQVGWMKWVKYKLAAFFAFHTNQPKLPENPLKQRENKDNENDHPGILLGGAAYRWTRQVFKLEDCRIHGMSPYMFKQSFLCSLLKSKAGMPRPEQEELRVQLIKTFKTLTTRPPPVTITNWAETTRLEDTKVCTDFNEEGAKAQIARTVQELFPKEFLSYSERIRPFIPSTNANFISSRKEGGSLAILVDLIKTMPKEDLQNFIQEQESSFTNERIVDENLTILDENVLTQFYKKIWELIIQKAQTETTTVDLVALAEALKVRVISKGPPYIYMAIRGIWKAIHSRLRNVKNFFCIGHPITEEYVQEILGQKLKENEGYMSGDYSAATDGLFSFCSEQAIISIAEQIGLSNFERSLCLLALTGHDITNPEDPNETKPQRRGQLMGSIMSFPILNIINCAAVRWAEEINSGKLIPLKTLKAAFNGDDIMARTTKDGYNIWSKIIQLFGLEESVGKTFFSEHFVQMNSTNFIKEDWPHEIRRVDFRRQDGKPLMDCFFRRVPLVNMGLIKGMKRSGGRLSIVDKDDRDITIGMKARELWNTLPSFCRNRCFQSFINENKELLEKTRLPWYIPEFLGGLGFPEYGKPSRQDLGIARKILLDISRYRPKNLSSISKDSFELSNKAIKITSEYRYNPLEEDVKRSDKLRQAVTLFQLFNANELTRTKGSDAIIKSSIRHNEKIWNPKKNPPMGLTIQKTFINEHLEIFKAPGEFSLADLKDQPTEIFSQARLIRSRPLIDKAIWQLLAS